MSGVRGVFGVRDIRGVHGVRGVYTVCTICLSIFLCYLSGYGPFHSLNDLDVNGGPTKFGWNLMIGLVLVDMGMQCSTPTSGA